MGSSFWVMRSSVVMVSEGLWLLQSSDEEEIILHADRIDPKLWVLHDVTVLFLDRENRFVRRLGSHCALFCNFRNFQNKKAPSLKFEKRHLAQGTWHGIQFTTR